jgi:hypothetical protein
LSFYFTIHTLLGLILGSASWLVMQGRSNAASVPLWVHTIGPVFQITAAGACLLAIITTFVNYSVLWTLATGAEIFFGMFLSSLINISLRALVVVTSVVTIPTMLGALWKFWYL